MIYRTQGPWGLGKGGDLTPAEVDQNFDELARAIETLSEAGTPPIAAVNMSGTQLSFTLANGDIAGPFTVPRAAFRFRGEWGGGATYFGNDVVSIATGGAADGIYLVRRSHTAASEFDPAADDGDGPLYQVMFAPVAPPRQRPAVVFHAEETFTPSLELEGAFVKFTTSPVAVTLPTTAELALPIGYRMSFKMASYGETSFTSTGYLHPPLNGDTGGIYPRDGIVEVLKSAADVWEIWGDVPSY